MIGPEQVKDTVCVHCVHRDKFMRTSGWTVHVHCDLMKDDQGRYIMVDLTKTFLEKCPMNSFEKLDYPLVVCVKCPHNHDRTYYKSDGWNKKGDGRLWVRCAFDLVWRL